MLSHTPQSPLWARMGDVYTKYTETVRVPLNDFIVNVWLIVGSVTQCCELCFQLVLRSRRRVMRLYFVSFLIIIIPFLPCNRTGECVLPSPRMYSHLYVSCNVLDKMEMYLKYHDSLIDSDPWR